MILDEAQALRAPTGGEYGKTKRGKNFEGTVVQAAMATTTTRARIGG